MFQNRLASLIVGSKFPIFCFVYLEGQFNAGFFALPVWGAYTWKGFFLEFYGITEIIVLKVTKISVYEVC